MTESIAAPSTGYIPVLDGLRALSIGLVIVGHLLLRERPTADLGDLGLYAGSHGVTVFFVISGYLITLLLLREETRKGFISLKNFYIRRFLRIFPAFYVYLAVFAILVFLGFIKNVPWHDFAASVLYLRNIFGRAQETSHLWSLSLEEQFYVLWPTVVVLTAARKRLGVLTIAIAGFTLWRAYLIMSGKTNWVKLYIRPDQRMDTILVGCGLALLMGGERFERWSAAIFERGSFATTVAALLAVWLAFAHRIPYGGIVEHTVAAVLVAAIVHWLIRNPDGTVGRFLRRPSLLFLGRLSYSLYLWQGLFLVERTTELAPARRFPVDLVFTFGCALASYYLVEKPFLALKDRRFR